MSRNAMRRNLTQSVRKTVGRYLAIVAIIALGAGIFVGLRATKRDMVATGQKFMDEQNMFDLRLLSSFGWSQKELDAICGMEGIEGAEGSVWMDALVTGLDVEQVFRVHSLPEQVSQVWLESGRMPRAADECLIDGYLAGKEAIGTQITIADSNSEDTREAFAYETYTVVGTVSSPLYMDMNRGNTSIGSGKLTGYFYIPPEGFQTDYFTEIQITLPGHHTVYTEEYHDLLEQASEKLEPLLATLAEERLAELKAEAEEAYADGLAEYEDGLKKFQDSKAETEEELKKAFQDLKTGEQEIAANKKTVEEGEVQIQDAQELLESNELTLAQSKQTLAEAKAETYAQLAQGSAELLENYKTVSTNQAQVNAGLTQIESGLSQIDLGIMMLELQKLTADATVSQMDTMLTVVDTGIQAAQTALDYARQSAVPDETVIGELEARLAELETARSDYAAKREESVLVQADYEAQLQALKDQKTQLETQQVELTAAKQQLDEAMAAIELGMLEMQNGQTQADNQFTAAEAQLESGQVQLETAKSQLQQKLEELNQGKITLEEAEKELDAGWDAYRNGRVQATVEFSKAQRELEEAKQQLDDARKTIDDMTENAVHILGRNTNAGYQAVDSNSDIVEGVSKVFPGFFLAVAALVCITTMTRMVSEERTQIGTLKALGYSNGAIIGKYLFYAGSGAVIGCGLGVILGSVVFPIILWNAYRIILHLTPSIVLGIDWPLCLMVVGMYVAAMLLVTWYCCRRELKEVPAELIRPRAPTTGKKILLEYFKFWDKISFLNKVMLRNVFRYRQRLLMMLLGIGGCTALLITGFGVRDSIMDLPSYQYDEVTVYDLEVYFEEGQSQEQQDSFRQRMRSVTDELMFYHQSNAELVWDDQARDVTMIAADSQVGHFIDFHRDEEPVAFPETGEALVSVGVAQMMGLDIGDRIVMRDPDLRELELTVSGIYENNVYNYVIVSPETVQAQWGSYPAMQMACVMLLEGTDAHEAGVKAAKLPGVMNVSVSEDIKATVGNMMEALNLVVVTIVVCAALLAAIVLYNLININIRERIREIATIKVLGFTAPETGAYVFKENLLLSAFGTVVGVGGGFALLSFVISQIKIDMIWMQPRVSVISCILAVIMTMLAACIVDFIFYFKLDQINMAEALKSVE